MQSLSDDILFQKISTGNKSAFDALFFKYHKPLYRFALSYCKNQLIAEESVQKTFIKIWNNHSNFFAHNNNSFNLLFTTTKNIVIDELRKENARRKYESSPIFSEENWNTDHDESKYIVKAILETAIEKLPKKARKIFQLAKQEGLTIQEIANYLKISNKTVENQLTIAYKKLRQHLEPFKDQLNF